MDRARYGTAAGHPALGAAEYSASVRTPGRDLFTFCMCAGGYVMPSVSEPGYFCTNGMSESRHDSPFANSGLVVTIEPRETGSSHPLAGVHYQQRFERLAYIAGGRTYKAPIQWARDFLAGRPSRGTLALELPPRDQAHRPGPSTARAGRRGTGRRPSPHGPAIRRSVPSRCHPHRSRSPRQLARADHPRPAEPAEPGRRRPLPLR